MEGGPRVPEDRRHHGEERALPQDVHRVCEELRHSHEHNEHSVQQEFQV